MSGEYTIGAVVAPILVIALELGVLRTGILATRRFWAAMAIVFVFQVPVDGWLTWLEAPVVIYRDAAISGLRWPIDIPVEDFGFGFALVGLTLMLWTWQARRDAESPPVTDHFRTRPGTGADNALKSGVDGD